MKALVTGGGGFLGGRIARMLHQRGDAVLVLGRRTYPHLTQSGMASVQADLRDARAVQRACAGMDVVFHAAAVPGLWGKRSDFREINVDGTRNVIDACRTMNVPKLVFTSSPSVVSGHHDLCGVDESQPYPSRYVAHYPATKAEAERLVLAADSPELAAVALRPHLIFGPGDPHLIPRIVARARAHRLWQVGHGENLVDVTYIDNAARAHLLAADRLSPQAACAGRAYFISQGEPVRLWPWLNGILRVLGAPEVKRRIGFAAAYALGVLLESAHAVLPRKQEPRMTRFLAVQLAKSHYFNISAARRDLGYAPEVSTQEGVERMLESMRATSTASTS